MPHFRVQIRERHRLMLLLLIGVAISILFLHQVGAGMQESVKDGGQIFTENLERVLAATTDLGTTAQGITSVKSSVTEVLSSRPVYVLGARIWLPLFLILFSFTAFGAAALWLLWIYLGFSAGVLLWTVVIGGGWRGPFYLWGLIFPQYLLYVPALLLIYVACLRWNRFWRERGCHLRMTLSEPQLRLFAVRLFLGIGLYGMGVWTEININPWILRKIFIVS